MTKKPDDWMPTYIRQYLGDTTHLTRDEHGGYLLLLFSYWLNGGPLDDDDKKLATMAHATLSEWKKTLRAVLEPFFTIKDGKWHSKRADEELEKARKYVAAKSGAGHSGAESKWQTAPDMSAAHRATRAKRLADARAKGSHTSAEWAALSGIFNSCVRCGNLAENLFGGSCVKDHIVPIYRGGSDGIENIQPMCRNCNSAKGPECVDYRDQRVANWRALLSERLANACPTPAPLPTTLVTIQPKETSFLNGNGKKQEVGEKKTTIKAPEERSARFQAKIAKQIGVDGWDTVIASTEPWRADSAAALARCQAAAGELGKEWPSNWPVKDIPDFLDKRSARA